MSDNTIKFSCGCEFDETNKPIRICEIHAVWLSQILEEKERERKLKKGGY